MSISWTSIVGQMLRAPNQIKLHTTPLYFAHSAFTFFNLSISLVLSHTHSRTLWSGSVAKCGRRARYNSSSIMSRYIRQLVWTLEICSCQSLSCLVVPGALGHCVWKDRGWNRATVTGQTGTDSRRTSVVLRRLVSARSQTFFTSPD